LLATIVGLAYAIVQIRKTKSAADAANDAAQQVAAASERNYRQHVAALAARLLIDAKASVEAKKWEVAAVRIGDLADQLAQLASTDSEWDALTAELRGVVIVLNRRAAGVGKFAPRKWNILCSRVHA